MWDITVNADFSAAHQLRNYGGKCEQLHGHNWEVQVVLRCDTLDHRGIAVDFREARQTARNVLDTLDHRMLNELGAFQVDNPSAENIARYVYQEMSRLLVVPGCRVHKVIVFETPGSSAAYFED